MADRQEVTFQITEPRRVPWLSLAFGYGAMLPLAAGAILAWLRPDGAGRAAASVLTVIWGGAILLFLAGVRRGLSFRTPGGPRATQIGVMLWLFLLGLAAEAMPGTPLAVMLLLAGFLTVAIIDPLAARTREVPLFMARLRPLQMLIPLAALGALLVLRLRAAG